MANVDVEVMVRLDGFVREDMLCFKNILLFSLCITYHGSVDRVTKRWKIEDHRHDEITYYLNGLALYAGISPSSSADDEHKVGNLCKSPIKGPGQAWVFTS